MYGYTCSDKLLTTCVPPKTIPHQYAQINLFFRFNRIGSVIISFSTKRYAIAFTNFNSIHLNIKCTACDQENNTNF